MHSCAACASRAAAQIRLGGARCAACARVQLRMRVCMAVCRPRDLGAVRQWREPCSRRSSSTRLAAHPACWSPLCAEALLPPHVPLQRRRAPTPTPDRAPAIPPRSWSLTWDTSCGRLLGAGAQRTAGARRPLRATCTWCRCGLVHRARELWGAGAGLGWCARRPRAPRAMEHWQALDHTGGATQPSMLLPLMRCLPGASPGAAC